MVRTKSADCIKQTRKRTRLSGDLFAAGLQEKQKSRRDLLSDAANLVSVAAKLAFRMM